RISFSMGAPLTITSQPKSMTAADGDTVTVSVSVAGGAAPYKYQWQVYMKDNPVWDDIYGSDGAKSSMTFTAYEATLALKCQYRCVITDAAGATVVSNAAALTEKSAAQLVITGQPKNVSTSAGENVSFSVTVSGGKAPYSYQWQYMCDGVSSWSNMSGDVNANILRLKADKDTLGKHYKFRCVITDAAGKKIESQSAALNQLLGISVQPYCPPVAAGEKATFSVVATGGKTPYSYQWQFMCDGVDSWTNLVGDVNSSTLSFTADQSTLNSHYKYRCIVTDATGLKIDTLPAALTEKVIPALTITSQPKSVTASYGQTVTFSVAVSGGTAPYTYQWYYSTDGKTWSQYPNSTRDKLEFSAKNDFSWQYRCSIKDAAGKSVITNNVKITETLPKLKISTQPKNITVSWDGSGTFTVAATGGKAPYSYQWYVSFDNGNNWSKLDGYTSKQASFSHVKYDTALYFCSVTDAAGQTVRSNSAKFVLK
ncbi:MAG: SprB repeat-containing protein, partial [Clostridia bacterium]|nr:SprB repeat-containing protein [Clostridia bacterium]